MNLLYFLLVQFSMFAVGAAVVAAWILLVKRPPRWWAYVFTMVSLGGIIGILMIRIMPTRTVTPSGLAWLYVGLVILGAAGMAGVAYDVIKRFAREVNPHG